MSQQISTAQILKHLLHNGGALFGQSLKTKTLGRHGEKSEIELLHEGILHGRKSSDMA